MIAALIERGCFQFFRIKAVPVDNISVLFFVRNEQNGFDVFVRGHVYAYSSQKMILIGRGIGGDTVS